MYTLKEIDANRLNKPDGNEKTIFLDQEDYRLKTKDGNGSIQELAVVDENASTPLVYKALLTQTGTDAPVATVLENTLGGTVVWSYNGVGEYNGALTGAFTSGKTIFPSPLVEIGATHNVNSNIYATDVDYVTIFTDGNGNLSGTLVQIEVYP